MMRVLLIFVPIALSACTSMSATPTIEELDWSPPQLSVSGCPNLSGRYIAPDAENYRWLFPRDRPEKGIYGGNPKVYQRDKGLDIVMTVQSLPDGIYIQADNGRSYVESFTPYDGVMVGCHGGGISSRFIGPRSGGEVGETGGCAHITYGEIRISLDLSGNIVVVRNQRRRCGTFGSYSSLPPIENNVMGPFAFRRIK